MKPLSFIVITYNRPDDTLALVKNIATLSKADELLQDIIVVNNASKADYTEVKSFISTSTLPFSFIEAGENLGVSKGRNFALKHAKGELVIFLDDDAVLQNDDALINVIAAFEKQQYAGREVAIVSFKVLYYDNLDMQKNALPHKNFEKYKDKKHFLTYYFAGGAHAIKRSVITEANGLPDEFYYGMEEYDLSYRILDKNYCIVYDDSIVMLHKESRLGRKPRKEVLRMMWVNKSKVAFRYLPKQYFYSTAILWSLHYLYKSGFHISDWIAGWKQITVIPSTEKRTVLKASTLQYLNEVEARLWY